MQYNRALAPAPWTYPSHSSFFTGEWPYKLNSQWKFHLDESYPTLAGYLASRGYQTAGFAANTNCCSYESGLARGFDHYEDYSLSPRSLLTRTVPGKWILDSILTLGARYDLGFADYYDKKWVAIQSRGATEINDRFLYWLSRRRTDRPFFSFLNFFDAHEPFIPPAGYERSFGIHPTSDDDYQFVFDCLGIDKNLASRRNLYMLRDCYDDCVFYLDQQLGRLLEALKSQGLLDNTHVFITSDHGESMGDHEIFGHSYTVYLDEIGVPLVILSPRAPAGTHVSTPVSLRDLPATVVDLVGLQAESPFPGHSLAAYWGLPAAPGRQGHPAISTPAFAEQADPSRFLE